MTAFKRKFFSRSSELDAAEPEDVGNPASFTSNMWRTSGVAMHVTALLGSHRSRLIWCSVWSDWVTDRTAS
jgi:hypothetical protein